jgi:hypothetical protein
LVNYSYWSGEEWIGLVHKQWQLRMKARDISETSGKKKRSTRRENIQKSTNFFVVFISCGAMLWYGIKIDHGHFLQHCFQILPY